MSLKGKGKAQSPMLTIAESGLDIAPWARDFEALHTAVLGWSRTFFADVPDMEAYHTYTLNKARPEIWENLATILCPNDKKMGQAHALSLLLDDEARPLFVQRLVLSIMAEHIFDPKALLGFSGQMDDALKEAEAKMRTVGCMSCLYIYLTHPDPSSTHPPSTIQRSREES